MPHSVVIGGAGFVGSWVVEEILKDPQASITIVDNLISSEQWNISTNPRVNFINGSAAHLSTFEQIVEPVDFVYQLACFHGNQSSIARPLDDFENGLKTTLVTLEWIKDYNPSARVIYSGAGCAVAEKTWDSPVPVKEVDSTYLLHDSPYSISKITGEMYCLYYAHQHELDVVRVRFQNIYGPREILGAGVWRGTENTIWRNVIPTFIWKSLQGETLTVFGSGSRDFVYVSDVARGVVLSGKKGISGQVYNLASGKETSINELAQIILHETGNHKALKQLPPREWDRSGRRLGDTEKSKQELGFETSVSLKEGIKDTLEWTITNQSRIEQAIAKHSMFLLDK